MSESDHRPLKVLAVLPVLGQPRHAKRIEMLKEAGFEVRAAAFERPYHKGRLPDCEVVVLGKIEHGRYLSRAMRLLAALPRLRREISRSDACLAAGPDNALAVLIAGFGLRRPILLEVGDLRRLQVAAGMKGWVVRKFDSFVVRRCALIISTASGFLNEYYRKRIGAMAPALILENKLDMGAVALLDQARSATRRPRTRRRLRIGWFGLLRCDWSWRTLEHLARNHSDHFEVVIAGHAIHPPDLVEQMGRSSGVRFLGEYKSPSDLPTLYEQVDLVWTVYPGPEVLDPIWRRALLNARSNRFYESCYFQRPIVTLAESADGLEVTRLGIGLCLETQDLDSVTAALLAISDDQLESWERALAGLPRSVYCSTTEVDELRTLIRSVIRRQQ